MADVILEHVNKYFDDFPAVKDANFHVKTGEFFTFLGPSGCGKTTTLRMIAGFSFPTSGKIYFDAHEITTLAPNKRDIGMVFQNYALFPHMTIGENVAFGLKIRKVSVDDTKKRVALALEKVHLGGYEKRKVHEISGGQQQRVALARALVIEPQILLLDEPLSNLDAKLRDETRAEIKRLQMELGITTIYVTHDQSEAMAVSDRIMIMNNGVTQQIGSPYEVYAKPNNNFVASFIGKHSIIPGIISEISNDYIYIKLSDGTIIKGLNKNQKPEHKYSVNESVGLAFRPECVEPCFNENCENLLKSIVTHAEFTGMNANYQLEVLGQTIRSTVVNQGPKIHSIQERIPVRVLPENIYLLPQEAQDV